MVKIGSGWMSGGSGVAQDDCGPLEQVVVDGGSQWKTYRGDCTEG